MSKRLLTAFLIAAAMTVQAASAASMSVQIMQNFEDQQGQASISYLIEQAVIDYFFEAGHIVSSAPVYVLSSDRKDQIALKNTLRETSDGGMEYLITVTVHYSVDKELKDSASLLLQYIKSVDWAVYAAKSGQKLASGSGSPGTITPANNNEKGIVKFSGRLAAQISAGLQKTR